VQPPKERSKHVGGESFALVVRAYLSSPKFLSLAPSTQQAYRRLLNLAARPDILGALSVHVIRPSLVQGFLDGLANRPGQQINARVALKAVERWAIVRELLPMPITLGTEVIGTSGGHKPWEEAQVAIAIERAKPEIARAVLVAANTGQRGSDLIRMRWSDLEEIDGRMGINVRQRKTGLQLWIPFTKSLTAAVATWERRPTPLLLKDNGAPWSSRGDLAMAWQRERDANPALVPCRGLVLHGLRATACVRLSRLGATTRQISDMVGLSEPMVGRYCRFSVQRDNAMAAVLRLDRTPWEPGTKKIKTVTD
jgi:integrase